MAPNTLTERYVHEVVRRIPADQREDVADELRATIADTIEAREPAGHGAAEREVLTEMGDPIRLAARYADRPLALIGAGLYPAYVRLLTVLLATVLPIVTVVTVVADVLDGHDLGSVIGSGLGAVLTVGAQLIAWLTVLFALVERFGGRGVTRGAAWTPDDLPDVPGPGRRGAAIGGVVVDALLLGLIVWQHLAKPYAADGGERLPVLDPALWSGWIWPVLAGLAAQVVLGLVRIAAGRWTTPLVAAHAAAGALFALPLAWILYSGRFFNPAFLTEVGGLMAPDAFATVSALGVLAVTGHDLFKRWRESRA
ncbi:HAAS signaling domain-containing protein [Nonomuraea sp. NPDC047897]|uniref:HAAS signaling domain-containing protein n=1 Tax=Nonomuraea sp. NPDC047897 TaxID=3364346 RepID=UPI003720B541